MTGERDRLEAAAREEAVAHGLTRKAPPAETIARHTAVRWPSSSAAHNRGRKKALAEDQVVELRRRAGAGEQKATLAREFGISRETLYPYLKVVPTA